MADHEEVIAGRSLAIFSGVDLFIRAVNANLQNLHEHASAIGDLVD
jgi:hypothetical protein